MPYNHKSIEAKWIQNWSDSNIYKTPQLQLGAKKKYILETFPYPSADGLHVGHTEGYTASDITARYFRAKGYKVLYPIGWDAFGLPTENFAKKKGLHPQDVTHNSIANFKSQMMRLGASYDWEREVNTSNPSYYKWTQWFFQLLYKRGLAYKKEALVNWDPVDMTVLANEQVLSDGTAERSGAKVEQKMMSQWFFKITDYAEKLLDGLENLDWPESTKLMQKNWIGKSTGAEVEFKIYEENINFLILHGWEGSADSNFIPKLKADLEKMGYQVQAPNLPGTMFPKESEQIEFILQNCKIDSNTIIIGHSLGTVLAMKLLEKINFKIKKCILVAAFEQPVVKIGEFPFSKEFNWNFDYQRISNSTNSGLILQAHNDSFLEVSEGENLSKKLGFKYISTQAQSGHFCGDNESEIFANIFESIKIFTTRVDTIFGVTYLVLAPEHHLVDDLTSPEQFDAVAHYKEKSKQKSQFERTEMNKDKTGVFTGSYCTNPFNGAKVSVWVGDYVLASYGTGAVMAVPAHDERDYEFAKKYDLEVIQVIKPKNETLVTKECFTEHGILFNSSDFNGLTTIEAKQKLSEFAHSNSFGNLKTTYRLRDWSIGRQRYWGCPIPVIYDQNGKEKLVPESDLPLLLPQDLDLSTGMIKPLRSNMDFINSATTNYGEGWTREGDTMDTFVCSSWYFFRYCSGNINNAFANLEDMKAWMAVDQYIIGAEHSTMHLLYARFFTKVLFDAGYIDFDEPFTKMRHQGLILGPDNAKMSKSKGNVINPNEVFDEYGADTLRMYEMFMGPFDQPKPWSTSSIKGVRRFLDRVWNMQELVTTDETYEGGMKVEVGLHKLVKKVGEDIETYGFNTCVSEFMKFVNLVEEVKGIHNVQYGWFLRVLAPFAPFITEEIWSSGMYFEDKKIIQNIASIHLQSWPEYMPEMMIQESVTIGVQINGKARGEVELSPTEIKENAQNIVMDLDFVKRNIEGKTIRKFVYVPGRIVNVVAN